MEKEKQIPEEKIGYRQILKQTEYVKLIAANLISRFGDSIDALAFTWLVYAATGSASWSAVIFALNRLPTILLQPFAGAAVERRNKKRLMILSDIVRGIVVSALAFCCITGNVNPALLAVFTLIISSVEAFCMPASAAMIPKVLEEKYYEFGMSLNSAASTVTELIGTGAAGIIIGVCGVETAIFIDACTFLGAAVIKMFLRVKEQTSRERGGGAFRQYMTDLKEGFLYMKDKKVILNFCIMAFFTNAMLVPLNSFQSPIAVDVLGQGSGLLSVIGIGEVIGMGAGSLLFPYLVRKMKIKNFICIHGMMLAVSLGGMTAGSLFRENTAAVYAVTAAASFVLGYAAALMSSAISVQFLKCVDADHLARENALLSAGATAAMPLVSFLLGILVRYVPVREIMIACSVLCVMIYIYVWFSKIRFEEEPIEKS